MAQIFMQVIETRLNSSHADAVVCRSETWDIRFYLDRVDLGIPIPKFTNPKPRATATSKSVAPETLQGILSGSLSGGFSSAPGLA